MDAGVWNKTRYPNPILLFLFLFRFFAHCLFTFRIESARHESLDVYLLIMINLIKSHVCYDWIRISTYGWMLGDYFFYFFRFALGTRSLTIPPFAYMETVLCACAKSLFPRDSTGEMPWSNSQEHVYVNLSPFYIQRSTFHSHSIFIVIEKSRERER